MYRLNDVLDAACAKYQDRIALVDGSELLSYMDLNHHAEEIARLLLKHDVRDCEPVAVLVSNQARDLAAFLGIWRAGAVAVPIHRNAALATMKQTFERTGVRLVISASSTLSWPSVLNDLGDFQSQKPPILKLNQSAPSSRALLKDAALVIFTSGTTGLPKGVVLSHQGYSKKLEVIDQVLEFDEYTRTLLVLQLTFSFGQWVSLLTLAKGGTLYLCEKFTPTQTLEVLSAAEITRIAVVPTMLRALLSVFDSREGASFLNTLRAGTLPKLIITGGEPLPAFIGLQIHEQLPHAEITDVYGLTETNSADFILRPSDYDTFPGTIGQPSPGVEYRITDENGISVSPGIVGELEILTPFIMKGYLDEPEKTANSFHEGFLRTGDLARTLNNGIVELVGRSKDLIFRGGNKISPLEIEQIFLEHPNIIATLATGVPDSLMGERIHLLVVLRSGVSLSEDTLRKWAMLRLEKFKIPDRIHFGEAIPEGRTGKADRNALRKFIMEE